MCLLISLLVTQLMKEPPGVNAVIHYEPLWNITAEKHTFQYKAATLWNRLSGTDSLLMWDLGLLTWVWMNLKVLNKCFLFIYLHEF